LETAGVGTEKGQKRKKGKKQKLNNWPDPHQQELHGSVFRRFFARFTFGSNSVSFILFIKG